MISLYLNAFSALIDKSMTLLLLNVSTVLNKTLFSMVVNALLALQLPSTIQKQRNAKNAHSGRASIRPKKSANVKITISGMIMPVFLALSPIISILPRSSVSHALKERYMIYNWGNVLAAQHKIPYSMVRNVLAVEKMSITIQHQKDV